MKWSTPDLCDAHSEELRVAAPIFRDFGGEPKFAGPAETIKCFEDNSLVAELVDTEGYGCLLYTSPSPRDATLSRMPSSA